MAPSFWKYKLTIRFHAKPKDKLRENIEIAYNFLELDPASSTVQGAHISNDFKSFSINYPDKETAVTQKIELETFAPFTVETVYTITKV